MTNCGNSAVMKMIAQIVRIYGSECKATSSNFTFVIFMVIKRLAPNGGVKKPVSQQTTNKIPNWMGWIPRALVQKYRCENHDHCQRVGDESAEEDE